MDGRACAEGEGGVVKHWPNAAEPLRLEKVHLAWSGDVKEFDVDVADPRAGERLRVPARPDEVRLLRLREQVAWRANPVDTFGVLGIGLLADNKGDVLGGVLHMRPRHVLLQAQRDPVAVGAHRKRVDVPGIQAELRRVRDRREEHQQ